MDFSQRLGSVVAGVYEFEAGDKIELQGLYEGQGTSTVQFNLAGARSGISIVAVGAGPQGEQGIQGDAGPAGGPEGPAGQDGNDGADGATGAAGAAGAQLERQALRVWTRHGRCGGCAGPLRRNNLPQRNGNPHGSRRRHRQRRISG